MKHVVAGRDDGLSDEHGREEEEGERGRHVNG